MAKKLRRPITILLVLLSIGAVLTGCAVLVIGGLGAAGGYYYSKGQEKKKHDGTSSTYSKDSTKPTTSTSTTGKPANKNTPPDEPKGGYSTGSKDTTH